MPVSADARTELMTAVPTTIRTRIISGMRWTLWLSVLAAPFGYGTSILLARAGPEVIGTYGLLMVYIGVVSSLFYVGGDPVVIKFVPELEADKRLPFLLSYFLVITVVLVPWLAAATIWSDKLHYLFGDHGGASFQLLVLYLSPIYILFSLVVAALKAMLEIQWAQTLLRILTVGSFLLYGAVFLGNRSMLASHYTGLVWGIYLGLSTLAFALGLRRLLRLTGSRCNWRPLRFFLPRGFWSYTLSTEQLSALGFFIQRLDLILVLNFGGLASLGKYVAILTFAEIIRVASRLFLDTLLPSLTNLLASRNVAAASQVFSMNLRVLLAVSLAATCGLMFLIGPVLTLIGPKYAPDGILFVLMVLFVGLATPGGLGGTLLSSVGKQQRAVWVSLGQLALFTVLFLSLWPRWQLLGVVVAYGVSLLLSNLVLLVVAKLSVPIEFSVAGDYAKFVLVLAGAGILALRLVPMPLGLAPLAWVTAMGLFFLLAHYRYAECRELARCFVPGRFDSVLTRLSSWTAAAPE
jgi:O-antigen/teichoic acid export membrane protein